MQIHCISTVFIYVANIQASPISWIQFIGVGGWEESGEPKASFCIRTLEQKSSQCVFIEVHKQPQFTCQAKTAVLLQV